jgi:hypothetical protein
MVDAPRRSSFLEEDSRCTLDDTCQFHQNTKHTMRDCEELKRAIGVPPEPKKTKSGNSGDRFYNSCYNNNHHYNDRYRRSDWRDDCDR